MNSRATVALCLVSIGPALIGCASSAPSRPPAAPAIAAPTPPPTPALDRAAHAASIAEQQIGTRYRYGGADPRTGFDCSGLVHYSYRQAGMRVPRTSQTLFDAARPVALTDARPGDVVFFRDQAKLSHVGIYLGRQRFVHAPSSGRTVTVGRLDNAYYREHFVAVGRLATP